MVPGRQRRANVVARWAAVTTAFAALSGCSNSATIAAFTRTPPAQPITNMTSALACLGNSLKAKEREGYIVPKALFIVDDLQDLTRNPTDYATGDLSFAGKSFFEHALMKTSISDYAVIPDITPQIFHQYFDSGVTIDTNLLRPFYLQPTGASAAFMISGGYILNDSTVASRAWSPGARIEQDDLYGEIAAARGKEERLIGMHVHVGSPVTNKRLVDIMLVAPAQTHSDLVNVSVGYRGFGMSGEIEDLSIEGTHSTQQLLAEAAAFITTSKIFNTGQECLSSNVSSASASIQAMDAWQNLLIGGQSALLRKALAAQGYLDNEEHGDLNAAIRHYEADLGMINHVPRNWDHLFLEMFKRGHIQRDWIL